MHRAVGHVNVARTMVIAERERRTAIDAASDACGSPRGSIQPSMKAESDSSALPGETPGTPEGPGHPYCGSLFLAEKFQEGFYCASRAARQDLEEMADAIAVARENVGG